MPVLRFEDLPGWAADDHHAAMRVYSRTRPAGWPEPAGDARRFFETQFVLRAPGDGPALLTGYHEPEIDGSLVPDSRYCVPLHGMPDGWNGTGIWHSRREIRTGSLMAGRELAWVADPVDAFLAQVQGSVRVRLGGGSVLRLGFAGKNGQPYRSIGAELVRRGAVAAERMSTQAIRGWCRDNPGAVTDLLDTNPSYVFFRQLDLGADDGPVGTAGVPLAALHSLAVDPCQVPLGAPVWVETAGPERMARLLVAQDTGSAIVGAHRGDIFFGTGPQAEARAGRMAESGRLVVLVPAIAP